MLTPTVLQLIICQQRLFACGEYYQTPMTIESSCTTNSGVELFVQVCLWTPAFIKYPSLRQGPNNEKTIRLVSRLSRENLLLTILACCETASTITTIIVDTFMTVVPASVVADGVWARLTADVASITYPAFPYAHF